MICTRTDLLLTLSYSLIIKVLLLILQIEQQEQITETGSARQAMFDRLISIHKFKKILSVLHSSYLFTVLSELFSMWSCSEYGSSSLSQEYFQYQQYWRHLKSLPPPLSHTHTLNQTHKNHQFHKNLTFISKGSNYVNSNTAYSREISPMQQVGKRLKDHN